MLRRKFKCSYCGHAWEIPYGSPRPAQCPQCKSINIHRSEEDRGYARKGKRAGKGGPPWAK